MSKWSENDASDFIVRACQLLPKSCVISELSFARFPRCTTTMRILYKSCAFCGSSEEFYIRPLNSCIEDVDELAYYINDLAFIGDFPELPNDFSRITRIPDMITCYKIESYVNYPGFVQLRVFGTMNYDRKHKKYEFTHDCVSNRYITGDTTPDVVKLNLSTGRPDEGSKILRGPATTHKGSVIDCDAVFSVRCPQWPTEAEEWPKRRRDFGWPKTDTISEVVKRGCHVVYAQHRYCRNDDLQWRLSFSGAEVILLQSWTKIQQIVYHLLRFFGKRELMTKDCPKENEVICTYHIKTVMLWVCEHNPPEWWECTSVITICSRILNLLLVALKMRYCPNYFIREANLFHEQWNPEICKNTEEHLNIFCNSEILCEWFCEKYILPFTRKFIKFGGIRKIGAENLNFMDLIPSLLEYWKAGNIRFLDLLFSLGFEQSRGIATYLLHCEFRVEQRSGLYLSILSRKWILLAHSNMLIQPMPECVSCFKYFDTAVLSLHAAYALKCAQVSWDIERFAAYFKGIFMTPKIVRCQYHIFPKPLLAEESKLQFLRAQDYMEDLTGSNSRSEDQLMFLFSKELLRKVLECDDSESNNIVPATLVYLAALHSAASETQIVSDLCSAVLMDETTNTDIETLNGGCLFLIDDVVRIVGFYLLCKRLNEQMELKKKQVYLDLRITPKVLAYYLTGRIPPELDPNLSKLKYPLNQFFLLLAMRKSSTSMMSDMSGNALRQCIHHRMASSADYKNLCANHLVAKERVTGQLVEYALENLTLFYSGIRKDFGIQCNTVDCYRALYLYQCHKYDEALHLCELILHEPDLQSDVIESVFANGLVLPLFDCFFDEDVQSLIGFLHLILLLLRPNCDLKSFNFADFISSEDNFCRYSFRDRIFLRRHFLAKYLKLRCLVDCNQPYAEAMHEFATMMPRLPFELVVQVFIINKLYSVRNISMKFFSMRPASLFC